MQNEGPSLSVTAAETTRRGGGARPGRRPSLNQLLKRTSRSFYLTLRVLPPSVRAPIGLAYLLARTTDTVADTVTIPWRERSEILNQLRRRILETDSTGPLDLSYFASRIADPSERELLGAVEHAVAALVNAPAEDRRHIRDVVETITSGQSLDLERFADAGPDAVIALSDHAALEDYTYRVAGCVGLFWTNVLQDHVFALAPMYEALMKKNGVWYGQGLQMVNILRDLPRDLRAGRCYLPEDRLAEAGLTPAELLSPAAESHFRPVYDAYLDFAVARLAAGWEYTNALPRRQVRVRLACAWPVLLGMKTVSLLRDSPALDPETRVKVSRREVYRTLAGTILCHPFRSAWTRLFARSGGVSRAAD